jgi:large repetitive protein
MKPARIGPVGGLIALGLAAAGSLCGQIPPPLLTNVRGYFLGNSTSPAAASVTAGGPDFTVILTGSNFGGGDNFPAPPTVQWTPSSGGCPVSNCTFSATFINSTRISVNLPAGLIASPDAGAQITARNYTSNSSNAIVFPVNPPITPVNSLPGGTVGTGYSAVLFTGGTAPYTTFLEAGQVPPGLSLPTTGNLLTGTPTTPGTYTFGPVMGDVWDSGSAYNVYSVTISGASLTFTPTTLPGGQAGTAYSQQLTGAGGTAPYYFSLAEGSPLPPGLNLSSSGLISGTPTAPGTYTFTINLFDYSERSGSGSRTITVTPAGLSVTPTTLPGAQLQLNYSASLQAAGGASPYTFAVVSGALPPGLFFSSTGQISGTPIAVGTFSFTVRATDAGQQTLDVAYSITVATTSGTIFFTPTTPPGGSVGAIYAQNLSGGGGAAPYTFSIVSGNLPFGVTLAATGAIRGTPQIAGTYTAIVRVTDAQGASGTALLTITVTAGVQILNASLPAFYPGQTYFAQLTATGGQPPYYWQVQSGALPGGLVLNSGTGLISGTPDNESLASTVTIQVRDAQGANATRSFDIPLGVRPPQISFTSLPEANVGTPYSFVLIATGGSGGLTWILESGTLPPGLLLSPQGLITGTPSAVGDYPFVLRVIDTGARFAVAQVHLLVNPPLLKIATGPLGSAPAGPVSVTFTATGGTPPYTWALGGGALPPGLSLSPAGVLSGIATTPGSYDFRLNVVDARRNNAAASFTLLITIPPLVLDVKALPGGAVGVAYSAALAVTGGTPPYRWSAGGLPPGLDMAQGSAAITGTPTTDGVYRVAITVTDSTGVVASATLELLVSPPALVITTRSIPAATAGQPYSAAFAATGGVPPYNWLISGNLPAGLRMSSGGVLSGTPAAGGSSAFTAIAADARGATARQEITLEVRVQPLAVTTQSLPGGTVGQRYSQTLAASGGVPPYVWSGTLPAGLAIDPATGAISGAPSSPGAATFAITVTDSTRASVSASFTVTFALPVLPPVTLSGPPATANPLQQSNVQLAFGAAFPVAVTGTLTLTFRGDTGADDAAVQFSTGGRTAGFTIPANSTQAAFSAASLGFQMGTTAGVITLTARLQAGTADVTPSPAPAQQIRINPGVPVITSVRATRGGAGIEVQVTGYSSTRELTQAQFRFTAAAGAALQTTDLTIPVDGVFSAWYGSAASTATGSQFTYTQQFSVQGAATAVQSLTVTLSNRQGASPAVSANVQ